MIATIILLVLLSSPIIFLLWHGLSNKFDRRSCKSKASLKGKTAVITGASAGIGKVTAKDFAARGARVILACRNMSKAKSVADAIIAETGNKNIVVYKLDTSDLQSVRNCAKEILSKENRLDILVNNAGMGGSSERILTKDGLELTMATNYYGHFLFTNLLLRLITKNKSGRIVNVSSQLHRFCFFFDVKNLNFENSWIVTSLFTYAQSKLCFNLFTYELARRLARKKSGVTVNVLHPGFVDTEIFSKSTMFLSSLMIKTADVIGNSEEQGAQTTIYLSVSEEVKNITGKYFDNCQSCSPSSLSENNELARELWDASTKDVGLKKKEIFL